MRCLVFIAILACLFPAAQSIAQPYVDLFSLRYTHAFRVKDKAGTPWQHVYAGADLPLKLKSGGYLVFSPCYESWSLDSAANTDFIPAVGSIALPVIVQIPLKNKSWTLALGGIPRFNSEGLKLSGNSFQIGGLTLLSYQVNPGLRCRLGVYVNKEFFGLYVVPLAGIDWKMGDRDMLFGVLPGRLTYEHRLSDRWYAGGAYRSTTNSYLLSSGQYLRIGSNQLFAYLDYYVAKRIVASANAGYGILGKLGEGAVGERDYAREYEWGDGLFVRLAVGYRIRL